MVISSHSESPESVWGLSALTDFFYCSLLSIYLLLAVV
ncbi:hypothetical protein swp_1608 [Shewanella piezotolerans WP3]|uniref:Uncharacterized protein n=1 Tax=Shewanella piezotolerans (strain WP3 / JCM 13877) TaxID=225849 RepID=B8CL62_SHEPW|nr:hypothetical protein swp_1608 [Shewanella piezotolerans WP3]